MARNRQTSVQKIREACLLMAIPLPDPGHWSDIRRGKNPQIPPLLPHAGPNIVRTTSWTPEIARQIINAPRQANWLPDEDVITLTGFKTVRRQREQLDLMNIPYALSGSGHPLVPVGIFEGNKAGALRDIEAVKARRWPTKFRGR